MCQPGPHWVPDIDELGVTQQEFSRFQKNLEPCLLLCITVEKGGGALVKIHMTVTMITEVVLQVLNWVKRWGIRGPEFYLKVFEIIASYKCKTCEEQRRLTLPPSTPKEEN